MYILYLDDSGSVNNQHEQYFVLGGVCVPEQSIRWLSYQLELLAQSIDAANPRSIEFHASEIFGGRSIPWSQFKAREQRVEILKSVLHSLDGAYTDIVTFACAVHKQSFSGQDPVHIAFEDISSRFDLFLRRTANESKQEHKGLIVLDKSTYETSLQNLARDFRHDGNRWGSFLTNISEVPLFVDSSASRIIQLADHIAYAVFRRYNANDLTYYNCIESRFDKDRSTGVIHGLVHMQNYNNHCTCPACITRRFPTQARMDLEER